MNNNQPAAIIKTEPLMNSLVKANLHSPKAILENHISFRTITYSKK